MDTFGEPGEAFAAHFGSEPAMLVRAPGRVNLIGEHTDYNDGFVLPMAIDRATLVVARPRSDQMVRVYSTSMQAEDQFSLETLERSQTHPWSNYIRGMLKSMLARDLHIQGADLLITGDLPVGGGLSSSASLAIGVGYTFQLLNDLNLLGEELALLAQGAEQSFVGTQCGIMDQFVVTLGRAGHAMLLDCRDLSYRTIPLPTEARVVVCDSGVRHELVASAYNERREACHEAVRRLRTRLPKLMALRDLTPAQLQEHADLLTGKLLPRVRHVVTEISRTVHAAAAMEQDDLAGFGQLMNASHASLRDDYEVSIPELDTLVELACALPGCYGSRMTGGGFGGSTVSLVAHDAVPAFATELRAGYQAHTGREAHTLVCTPAEGVRLIAIA
ncbi:galactokinase [Candidatus Chloroploca asiatica]|uniref:Galactokinase n=1 Tax=Candidatus Chloroploca asiatica TaxID=1506545 RepID=A0A2H3L3H5_9CHLR|nr:galactokinase [Candidatus Chloroploca asiatica]PDV97692.1 galactokinase [Candidatus Chloroploca asiatica]